MQQFHSVGICSLKTFSSNLQTIEFELFLLRLNNCSLGIITYSKQGNFTTAMINNPIVLFDGVCNFCNRMVNFAIRNDKKAKLKFTPLQSDKGQALKNQFNIPDTIDTVILLDKDKVYTYARAAIRISKYLDWPGKMMYAFIIIPSFISQPLYKWFARHRYKWFGKKETCMIPTKEVRDRFLE